MPTTTPAKEFTPVNPNKAGNHTSRRFGPEKVRKAQRPTPGKGCPGPKGPGQPTISQARYARPSSNHIWRRGKADARTLVRVYTSKLPQGPPNSNRRFKDLKIPKRPQPRYGQGWPGPTARPTHTPTEIKYRHDDGSGSLYLTKERAAHEQEDSQKKRR